MMIRGDHLGTMLQSEVLRRYVHRYTGEHKPQWAQAKKYPVQFKDDDDWLAHTYFAVTKRGTLDARVNHCESRPTWPKVKP